MKKLLLLTACLLALAAPLRAAAGPPDIVVVRIYEGAYITAIITRGEGKSEKVKFDNGNTDKRLTRASEGYYKLVQQLYSEGYMLQSTMMAQDTPSSSYTTLLFVKGQ